MTEEEEKMSGGDNVSRVICPRENMSGGKCPEGEMYNTLSLYQYEEGKSKSVIQEKKIHQQKNRNKKRGDGKAREKRLEIERREIH